MKSQKKVILEEINEFLTPQKCSFEYIFNGLVEPTDAEKTLNGYKIKKKQIIDAEQQTYIALDAFQKNNFFVLF